MREFGNPLGDRPPLDELARTDLLLDALAEREEVDFADPRDDALAALLGQWRDDLRWPPASALVSQDEAVAALRAGVAQRRRARRSLAAVGSVAAALLALIGVFDKIGVKTGIDFFDIADAAEDVVRPAMPAECLLDRNALIMGYSGVYSSFLKHAVRQAERYGVPASALLHRAGQRKLIGGQEDQLIDIALEIKRELDSGAAVTH